LQLHEYLSQQPAGAAPSPAMVKSGTHAQHKWGLSAAQEEAAAGVAAAIVRLLRNVAGRVTAVQVRGGS
jgi:hypothetical protein